MHPNLDSPSPIEQAPEKQLQLISFLVGPERFAVDIQSVQEITRTMRLTTAPQNMPGLDGILDLRGRIVPVISLRMRFGSGSESHTEASRIVVVQSHGDSIGLLVDSVQEIVRIDESIVEKSPRMHGGIDASFVNGVVHLEESLLILLDLENLVPADVLRTVPGNRNQAA